MTLPAPTSTSNFQSIMLAWLNDGAYCDGTEAGIEAFVDWAHEEAGTWLTSEEWEDFCVANNMA